MFFFFYVIYLKIKKDQATKEKALQNMSSMSSAQIVSASSLHNNKTSLSGLGLPAPVSYPPPVSSNLFALLLSDIFFQNKSFIFNYGSFGSLVFNPDLLKSKPLHLFI